MTKFILRVTLLITVAFFSTQTFAGAPTTLMIVNGPGIPSQGIEIKGNWPGWITFIDEKKGPVPAPPSDLPRYALKGYTERREQWYTVLYVWDYHSHRALVYLPGPSDSGYQGMMHKVSGYEKLAGKWYFVLNEGSFQGWAESIRKVLPQISASPK